MRTAGGQLNQHLRKIICNRLIRRRNGRNVEISKLELLDGVLVRTVCLLGGESKCRFPLLGISEHSRGAHGVLAKRQLARGASYREAPNMPKRIPSFNIYKTDGLMKGDDVVTSTHLAMTPAQERAVRYMQRANRYMEHQRLVEAQAFNEWLSNRSLAAVCERKLNLQLAKRDGIWTSQTTKDEGQEILCLLGRRWARAQRVLVRYDAETKTVLSYLCELVQRASERSYLAKRGFARVTSHFFLDDYLNAPDPVSETPFLLDSDDGGRRLSEAVSGNQAGGALTALGEGALAAGVVH
ncbi:hypothetical protein AK812_SmicGene35062 [Symbiodinium microadriaticum]|uniref:Uncharacterized protein n=1 Tax=Symbiodinium microadriaticum TaxID=2951 RepID=A0A1Q9CMF7_SYMMI|nr:hypothetical protein AK812_SmicGene35062 [Symbiodinium microadriaticum]